MDTYVSEQLLSFIVCILIGIFSMFIYDVCRVIRYSIGKKYSIIMDIFYIITVSAFVLLSLFFFTSGEMRWYIFAGLLIGTLLYFSSASKIVIVQTKNTFEFLAQTSRKVIRPFKVCVVFIGKWSNILCAIYKKIFKKIAKTIAKCCKIGIILRKT